MTTNNFGIHEFQSMNCSPVGACDSDRFSGISKQLLPVMTIVSATGDRQLGTGNRLWTIGNRPLVIAITIVMPCLLLLGHLLHSQVELDLKRSRLVGRSGSAMMLCYEHVFLPPTFP